MNEDNRDPKSANSEDYDPNHPQDLNKPVFNSTTDHRSTRTLPGVENLDHQLQKEEDMPQDTSRLSGSDRNTDLGNDNDEKADEDDERIISR